MLPKGFVNIKTHIPIFSSIILTLHKPKGFLQQFSKYACSCSRLKLSLLMALEENFVKHQQE